MTELTAGEMAKKAKNDSTKYNALELGREVVDELGAEFQKCINKHNQIFDEDEYFVGYVIASDPIIKNLQRRKFYAWMFLPKPRPNQSIWLYSKKEDKLVKRIWTLPNAWVMACLSQLTVVDKAMVKMKRWSDAFFDGTFHEYIRKEHDINHLTEKEYIDLHRDELIKSGCKIPESDFSDPFDFSKFSIKKIVDSQNVVTN